MTKFRNASLVGSSLFCLACLGLQGCGSNDDTTLIASGGASGFGNSPTGGLSSVATTGGSATTSASTGGSSNSSSAGGTSSVGGSSQTGTATGGTSSTSTGGASSEGGSATGGSSTTGTGGAGVGGVGGASTGGTSAGGAETGGTATTGGTSAGGDSAGGSTAAGTTGTGGSTSSPVTPTNESDSDYRFTMTACKVVMDINPKIGARVTKLTYGGSTNVITPFTCASYNGDDACNNSGSTFWTSPQSAWSPNWPPVPEIDGRAYTPEINGTSLTATGPANTALGASVIKEFSADDGTCWVTLLYTIKASKAIQAAPWEITRVPRGGLAFFPRGDSSKLKAAPLTVTTSGSPATVWFDDKSKTATSSDGSKLIADGAEGWIAYVLNGNLFLKKYVDVQPTAFAPSEGDVEIYPGDNYLELEVQGAYTSLAANATLPWTVQWRVVPIPSNVTVAAGNAELLAFARAEAAK